MVIFSVANDVEANITTNRNRSVFATFMVVSSAELALIQATFQARHILMRYSSLTIAKKARDTCVQEGAAYLASAASSRAAETWIFFCRPRYVFITRLPQ